MHYVALIIGVAVSAGFLIWRIHRYLTIARTAADTVRDVKDGLRRARWTGKSADRPLEEIDDPMLVAACILLIFIRCDRDITGEDRASLALRMQDVFGIDQQSSEELLGEAEFLIRDVTDHQRWTARLAGRLVAPCSEQERLQVLELAESIAQVGPESDRRTLVLKCYRENAKIDQI